MPFSQAGVLRISRQKRVNGQPEKWKKDTSKNHLVLDKTSSSILTTIELDIEIKGVIIPFSNPPATSLFLRSQLNQLPNAPAQQTV